MTVHRFSVVATVVIAGALVLVYAYLVLPLDLGRGLKGGYVLLGSMTFGVVTTSIWVLLTLLVIWRACVAVARTPSVRRTVVWAAVAGAVSLLTSYPLVVLYMFVSLDAVMPTGQVAHSLGVGRLYWGLVLVSVATLVVAPFVLAAQKRSTSTEATKA